MVERPIKKSERQTVAQSSDVVEDVLETEPSRIEGSPDSITSSPEERKTIRPLQRKDKTKGKGKDNQHKEERSSSVNPALMRGPKPTKPKPPVIQEPEEGTELNSVAQEAQEDT